MSVGVLAFNSLTLFMVVPGLCACQCACLCVFEWVEFVVFPVHVCVCEVRLGSRLLLWFSGSARGVGVTFSPSLSSICRAVGSALGGAGPFAGS